MFACNAEEEEEEEEGGGGGGGGGLRGSAEHSLSQSSSLVETQGGASHFGGRRGDALGRGLDPVGDLPLQQLIREHLEHVGRDADGLLGPAAWAGEPPGLQQVRKQLVGDYRGGGGPRWHRWRRGGVLQWLVVGFQEQVTWSR